MNPKPNPSDFTFNGVLQQPHYDYAVRAWEKMEGMEVSEDGIIELSIKYREEKYEQIAICKTLANAVTSSLHAQCGFIDGFKSGVAHSQKEIDRLNAYIEDLSKGYEH